MSVLCLFFLLRLLRLSNMALDFREDGDDGFSYIPRDHE